MVLAGIRLPETGEIDEQIAKLPVDERQKIRSLDAISMQEKIELIRSSRCLVLASKNESFGMVILEAWAQAVPTVALDLPVYREIITHRHDGLLAQPDDTSSLAESILFLLVHPESAKSMGLQGYHRARSHYSWEHVAQVHLRAYQHAANHKAPV